MMEREELMENMYEKKIEILERNVLETQIYTRKKRKREKEEEEVCMSAYNVYLYRFTFVYDNFSYTMYYVGGTLEAAQFVEGRDQAAEI